MGIRYNWGRFFSLLLLALLLAASAIAAIALAQFLVGSLFGAVPKPVSVLAALVVAVALWLVLKGWNRARYRDSL